MMQWSFLMKPSSRAVTLLLVGLTLATGCSDRPSEAEVTALCDQYTRMTLLEGFQKQLVKGDKPLTEALKKQGEDMVAKAMASGELKQQIAACVKLLTTRGTKKQAACMAKAKTARAWTTCID